jgi:predicted transcriptional regulator of viral defense system
MRKSDSQNSVVRRFLAAMAEQGKHVFRLEQALPYWSSPQMARKALSRLERRGWLKRLERGLYLIVPLDAGPDGQWSEDPLVIAAQLAPEGAVAYWSALHYWGMTEQIPRTIFVQTVCRRYKPMNTILGVRYRFVVVVERKLFGIMTQFRDGLSIRITDREKTLIDALDRPDLCGGISQVVEALKSLEGLDWARIDSYLELLNSGAVYKRIGYLVDELDITVPDQTQRLMEWRKRITKGIALLEPGFEKTGSINTRWRVRVNTSVMDGFV